MKFMLTWKMRSGDSYRPAVERFLKTGGKPPKGVTSIDRWHSSDLSTGFHLVESNSASALMAASAEWDDLLELHIYPVVGDAEAGPVYAKSIGA